MKHQLELLVKLQTCDLAILKAQKIQEEHPQKITQLEEALEKEKKELQSKEKQLEEIKKKRIGKEQSLAIEEEKVKKARERLTSVKTNKEYQASLKEIEAIEKQNSKIEEEILVIMEDNDQLNVDLEKMEANFKLMMKQTEEKKTALKKQIEACTNEIEEKQKIKELLVPQIQSELMDIYKKIKQKRTEITVVPVEDSCCHGCHMNIPTQLFNEVMKCKRIITCPHCSRILYWKKNHDLISGTIQPQPQ